MRRSAKAAVAAGVVTLFYSGCMSTCRVSYIDPYRETVGQLRQAELRIELHLLETGTYSGLGNRITDEAGNPLLDHWSEPILLGQPEEEGGPPVPFSKGADRETGTVESERDDIYMFERREGVRDRYSERSAKARSRWRIYAHLFVFGLAFGLCHLGFRKRSKDTD